MEQRTDDWFTARLGKVTASKIADVMATTKTGPSASRKNYMAQLLTERLTGQKADSYSNAAMQWGVDTEPQARAMYELETGRDVVEVGFIDHPVIAMSGASPDGLVGEAGLVEIKCPNTATHIETLRGAAIDKKYVLQTQWQMACTGRQWCDFVSFDPRLPSAMQLYVARVERDATLIAAMESEVASFLAEINKAEEELRAKYMEN
jgi:putative phage-type endonuclease